MADAEIGENETVEDERPPSAPDIEMRAWEWVSGGVPAVDIPANDTMPVPPSASSNLRSQSRSNNILPDLTGKSLEAVQREADRIQLGEYFTSFIEFDRCLHSWCVLHGRVAARLKTNASMCVRICRFGNTRKPWRHPPQSGFKDGHLEEESDLECEFQDADWIETPDECEAPSTAATKGNSGMPLQNIDPNSLGSKSGRPDATHGQPGTPDECATPSTAATKGNSGAPLQNIDPNTLGSKSGRPDATHGQPGTPDECAAPSTAATKGNSGAPLQNIDPNTLGSKSGRPNVTHGQSGSKGPRTIVQHTRVWLPGRMSQHGNTGASQVTRQRSHTGACGELSRFPPAPEKSPSKSPIPDPCPFRVRCHREVKTGRCRITICMLNHTCPQFRHKWRGPTQKSFWLGETLAPRVTRNVKVPVKELLDGFQADYYKTSTYHQMWRSRDLVRDWYLGGQRKSFHQIPALLHCLAEIDPGCVVDWCTEYNSVTFKRAFICPSATRGALKWTQPVVSLDACHTKNRKFPTQLFLATILDGNSQVLILCFGVAPVENTDNWEWFLRQLQRAIHGIEEPHIAFISDRQKGLLAAVAKIFPGKVHGACANHLRANVKTNYGKAAAQFFGGCIYANSQKVYDTILERLEASMAKGVAAKQYIETIDPKLYARFAFPLPRMSKVTSNPAEQANSGLLPLRDYAPFKLLVELWYYLQARFNDRRSRARRSVAVFTKQATNRHDANLKTHGQWKVFDDGGDVAKIETTGHTEQYLVKLSPHPTCTCFELQEMCWPCQHIMAWDSRDGRDFSLRFHICWKTESLRMLYEPQMPCFLSFDLDLCQWCCPPEVAVQKGRHRVVRLRRGGQSGRNRPLGDDEYVDPMGNLFMRYPIADDPSRMDPMPSASTVAGEIRQGQAKGRRQRTGPNVGKTRCSTCGRAGHNKRSCSKVSTLLAASIAAETTTEVRPPSPSLQDQVSDEQVTEPVTTTVISANGIPEYSSSSSEDDASDAPTPTPNIVGGKFGTTQNPSDPEWMAHGEDNYAGYETVQYWLDLPAP